ncbi:MAG: aldehyde-activating protein [Gammaproteobacteria bacterium]|nr:MAG: aldehyde-activating protein [Gammaproteobacteria bacterium]
MTTTYKGGCACKAIRYEISGDPLRSVDCQCRDCTHESGTGHASHLVFLRADVKLTGTASTWEMTADSGNIKTRGFCPTCGSPVFMTFKAKPDIFSVRAASLDDPSVYKPQVVVYRASGYVWDNIDKSLPNFETMPPV